MDRDRDVTGLAAYQSNEAGVASVVPRGVTSATGVMGEAAITARYLGKFAIHRVAVPLGGEFDSAPIAAFPRKNYIDDHVASSWERLRLLPSAMASDEKFLRRVYIDIIGQVPTSDEARAFLDSTDASKREKTGSTRCWPGLSTPSTGPTSGLTCCGQIPTASGSRRR